MDLDHNLGGNRPKMGCAAAQTVRRVHRVGDDAHCLPCLPRWRRVLRVHCNLPLTRLLLIPLQTCKLVLGLVRIQSL